MQNTILQNSEAIRAADFFRELHRHQFRKDNIRPYFVHLQDVAWRLARAGVEDVDVIVAGYGHDSLEDIYSAQAGEAAGFEILRREFGERAALIIEELTDVYTKQNYPALNRKQRKQLERERYKLFTPQARLVKLADIASNLADDGQVKLTDNSPEVGFNRIYIREKSLCLPYLAPTGAENQEPYYPATLRLFFEANEILEEKRAKLGIK